MPPNENIVGELREEITMLKNTKDCIRKLLGEKVTKSKIEMEDLNDPVMRELLAERNMLLYIQDGIRSLLGTLPGPHRIELQSTSFSPLASSTPTKRASVELNVSDTHLKKEESVEMKQEAKEEDEGMYATDDPISFEAGQRWPSIADEAGCNNTSGSITFYEPAEVEQQEKQENQQDRQNEQQQEQHQKQHSSGEKRKTNKIQDELDDSYDRVPRKCKPVKNMTKNERKELPGYTCNQCERGFKAFGVSDEDREKLIQKCTRHRGQKPPQTQEFYWYAGWVPTQQWEEFLKKEEDKKKKREENDDETF